MTNEKNLTDESRIKEIECLYQKYNSISAISEELGINRKIVSFELKKLGYTIHTDSGYQNSLMKKYAPAIEEYLDGKGIAFLSRKYRFDPARFSLYLYDQGIDVENGKIALRLKLLEGKLEQALELYEEKGMGVRKIANLLNIPRHYIQYYLQKNGKDTINGAKKYKIDETVFEKLNNEENAYWYGYLLADGNVYNRVRHVLELVSKDKEHLEKFKSFLKTDAPITEKKIVLGEKTFICHRILIHNKKIVNDLINLGISPNKSLIVVFPSFKIVPKELVHHFIRGYFDGDGHISPFQRYQNNNEQCFIIFVGTKSFLQSLPEFFGLKQNKLTQKGKAFSLRYGGNKKAFGIANYLYQDAKIFLDRKYNEYTKWRDQNNKTI